MDEELVLKLIARDWPAFLGACSRLNLGTPIRNGARVDLLVSPDGTEDKYRAVLLCDEYEAQAPLLDFADIETGVCGREHWPRMANAPMNSIPFGGRDVPIVCIAGTRGYHLHSSHVNEAHPRTTWSLPAVATIIWRLFHQCGTLTGRGV